MDREIALCDLRLIRDGTLFGPHGTEIDLRTPDYSVWVTVKADSDEAAEAVADLIEARCRGDHSEQRCL